MSWLSGEDGLDYDDFDESDVRVRPSRRGTRPRTKTRPQHADAVRGRVLAVDRGRYTVMIREGSTGEQILTAARARELRRTSIVNGDRVDVVGDLSGDRGTLARVVRVAERSTVLRRSADDTDSVERMIVANADQMLIVVAAADPEPRPRLVDRYLVAAFDAGIDPLLVVTKTDIADPEPFLAFFDDVPLTVFTSRSDAIPSQEIAEHLVGHATVFVGHSGVGKSTLVNALVPSAHRATGQVNAVTGRGRHTSSSAVSYRVDTAAGNGWIIDTPGVRSFGLGHVNVQNVIGAFPDLARTSEECPRGCTHEAEAPDCALGRAAAEGELSEARVDSFRRLMATLTRDRWRNT